jgi:hypothetical protein
VGLAEPISVAKNKGVVIMDEQDLLAKVLMETIKAQQEDMKTDLQSLRSALYKDLDHKELDTAVALLQQSIDHMDSRLNSIENGLSDLLTRAIFEGLGRMLGEWVSSHVGQVATGFLISVITFIFMTFQ